MTATLLLSLTLSIIQVKFITAFRPAVGHTETNAFCLKYSESEFSDVGQIYYYYLFKLEMGFYPVAVVLQ
jgi:hypothetical protein